MTITQHKVFIHRENLDKVEKARPKYMSRTAFINFLIDQEVQSQANSLKGNGSN